MFEYSLLVAADVQRLEIPRAGSRQMPPAPVTPRRAGAACAASTGHRGSKYLHRAGQGESKQGFLIYGPWQQTPWVAPQHFRPL